MYSLSQVKHRHEDGDDDEARPVQAPRRTLMTPSSLSDPEVHTSRAASGLTENSGGGSASAISTSHTRPSVARMTYEMEKEASDYAYNMQEGEDAARGSEKAGLKPQATTPGAMAVAGPPPETKGNAMMMARPSQGVARMNPYELEDEVEDYSVEDKDEAVDSSFERRERVLVPAVSRSTDKSGALRTGSTTVGAVAVAGRVGETRGNLTTTYESSYDEDSFVNRSPPTGSEEKGANGDKTPTQDQPIEATCVSDTEADIEAQVQSRMQHQAKDIAHLVHKELMTNAAVPVEVQPSVQDTSSVTTNDYSTDGGSQKKKVCIIAIVLLAIVAAVGAGVGVALSKKSPDEEEQVPTQSPTLPPTPVTTRAEVFQDFLAPISGEQLKDTNSPQFQALAWLANDDPANMTVGVASEAAIKTRYVAAVLYYAFQGDTWANKYRFLSERDTCSWNQRFVDGDHGITCGADGTVESFLLPANNLVGSIPREIGYYTNLNGLDLSSNTIDGSLASLVNLTRIDSLNCSLNALSGTLPEFLFDTQRSLTNIDLDHNSFFGSISDSLGMSSQLLVFWAQNNSLTGTIPAAIGQSWVLGSLDLSSNQLTGTIPDFVSSSRVWNLHLERNKLTGTIPTTIGSLSALKSFYVAGNGNEGTGISGPIPSELGNCKNLKTLWLNNNTLAESIPTELGSILSLEYLYLRDNRLTGDIPTELGNSPLRHVDFAANYLTSDIGPVVEAFPRSLDIFSAGGNQLRGTIPTSIGSFVSLVDIDFGRNDIGGTIPSQFGNLVLLEQLRVSENNFVGTLPTSIASLPNLIVLQVNGNGLNGTLDEFCTVWNDPFGNKGFAANTCGEPDDIACPCCNYCCSIDIFECRLI